MSDTKTSTTKNEEKIEPISGPSKEQEQIIKWKIKSIIKVIACAGSGKTRTMIARIIYMIEEFGANPEHFFIVTFTKNAAKHMINMLNAALKKSSKEHVRDLVFEPTQIGTFHALSKRILKAYDNLDKSVGAVFNVDELQYHFLNFLKTHPDGKLVKHNTRYVFVDEFQDVNQVQYDIVKEMSSSADTLMVVGDDDQNIYGFRNISSKFLHQLSTDFKNVETFYLSTNYRCTQPIVSFANAIISQNPDRLSKPDSKSGVKSTSVNSAYRKPILIQTENIFSSVKPVCERILALTKSGVTPGDICVLSRNGSILYKIQCELIERKIQSIISGEDDFERNLTTERMNKFVFLSTIHSSKGLEWEHCFIIGLDNEYFPHSFSDLASEYRLMYVAITRAKRNLIVFSSYEKPCPFITSIPYKQLCNVGGPEIIISEIKEVKNSTPPIRWEGVTNCIRRLDGNDYINLKKSILPDNLTPLLTPVPPSTVYTTLNQYDGDGDEADYGDDDYGDCEIYAIPNNRIFPYYSFIEENRIQSEFGQFLDLLARRTVAEYAYKRYKNGSDEDKKIMTMEEIDKLYLDDAAEECTCGSKARFVPARYANRLKNSYNDYKNKEILCKDMIARIYVLSFCSSIIKGKQYVLHVPVELNDLSMYKEMYGKIEEQVARLIGKKSVKTAVHVSWSPGDKDCKDVIDIKNPKFTEMKGVIDMVIDDSIVIDFKNTLFEPGTCKIEFFLQVLIYASLLQIKNGKEMKQVGIYNIMADSIFLFDISKWTGRQELIKYLFTNQTL